MAEIFVQVAPTSARAGQLGGPSLVERLQDRVGELSDSIGEVASDIWQKLEQGLPARDDKQWAIDELQLKFSLDLKAEGGVVVARAATTAGFEVTLTMKRNRSSL